MGGEWVVTTRAPTGARMYWIGATVGTMIEAPIEDHLHEGSMWIADPMMASVFLSREAAENTTRVMRGMTSEPVTVEPWLPF